MDNFSALSFCFLFNIKLGNFVSPQSDNLNRSCDCADRRDTKTQGVAPAVSSEQLEMRKIHELRRQLARSRKMAGESMRMAQTAPGPVRATVHHVTKTEEFHFATDSRVKDHTMETRLDAVQKDFPASLRGPTDQTVSWPSRVLC